MSLMTRIKTVVEHIAGIVKNKQDKLVSGETIKTINGNDILGPGDIEILGGSGGSQNIDGGNASSVYAPDLFIDGGNA